MWLRACQPSTIGFDRFVQGWAAESTMTVLVLLFRLISLYLINPIKSYLLQCVCQFGQVHPSWSSNSSPSLSSVASSVRWGNSLLTANKSDTRARTTPQRGRPRALKFQPFPKTAIEDIQVSVLISLYVVECWMALVLLTSVFVCCEFGWLGLVQTRMKFWYFLDLHHAVLQWCSRFGGQIDMEAAVLCLIFLSWDNRIHGSSWMKLNRIPESALN